jgi:hypothetical protein
VYSIENGMQLETSKSITHDQHISKHPCFDMLEICISKTISCLVERDYKSFGVNLIHNSFFLSKIFVLPYDIKIIHISGP